VQTEKGFEMKSVRLGIVELKKVKTLQERRMVLVGPVGEEGDWKKQKKFIETIRREWEYITGEPAKDLYRSKEDE